MPRPQHTKADEETQRAFKKLPEELEAIRQAYPQASVELWSTDEHRIGLRRVWALKGSAVKAVVAHRYEWMYVYACVHPESGRTSWLLLPERECGDLLSSLGSLCATSPESGQTNTW